MTDESPSPAAETDFPNGFFEPSTARNNGNQDNNLPKKERILVGRFKYRGEIKHFAFVPGSMIKQQKDMLQLMKHWGLTRPDFILETNTATKGAMEDIITSENAPYTAEEIFFEKDDDDEEEEIEPTTMEEESQSTNADFGGPEDTKTKTYSKVKAHRIIEFTNKLKQAASIPVPVPKDTMPDCENPPRDNEREDTGPQKWVKNLLETGTGVSSKDRAWINRFMQRKVVYALSSVVSAADMLNGWLLCHGKPSLNERYIEAALDQSGSAPTGLVVDNLEEYNPLLYKALIEHVCIMREVDLEEKSPAEIYDLDSFLENTYRAAGVTGMRRRSTVSRPIKTKDDDIFWDKDDITSKMNFPWMRGTHFIFSDRYEYFSASMLGPHGHICMHGDHSELADPKTTGAIIRGAVWGIQPCLLLNNTGGEPQMYARLINEIARRHEALKVKYDASECQTKTGAEMPKKNSCWKIVRACIQSTQSMRNKRDRPLSGLMDDCTFATSKEFYETLRIELRNQAREIWTYTIAGAADITTIDDMSETTIAVRNTGSSRFVGQSRGQNSLFTGSINVIPRDPHVLNIADVLQVVDLYCLNPRLFTKVVVPVDPINESPDSIVNKLMKSFARSSLEAKEVGAGDADEKVVERAWRFHHQLDRSRAVKRFNRDLLYSIYIIAGFLTTVVAVVREQEARKDERMFSENSLQWLTLGLAATVSICAGVLGLLDTDSQLAKIETAQAKIVFELYHFRMRTGKYSLDENEREGEKADKSTNENARGITVPPGQVSTNRSTAMHRARDNFARQLNDFSRELGSLDLYADRLAHGRLQQKDKQSLELYVLNYLQAKDPSGVLVSGVMTSAEYYETRVCPLLELVESEEDFLRMKTRMLQLSSMALSTGAVILSAEGTISVIPAVVAGATGLFQFLKVNDYERRFEIASAAARELGALDSYWQSLSDLDRLRRSSVVRLVKTCEDLALQFETSSIIHVDNSELDSKVISAKRLKRPTSQGEINV